MINLMKGNKYYKIEEHITIFKEMKIRILRRIFYLFLELGSSVEGYINQVSFLAM